MKVTSSEYMLWAKTKSQARYNLATSGVQHYPLSELPVSWSDLELSGPSFYGYPPLQSALAAHCGVDPECLVAANGTSMANHLAMAALLEPGDEVLIEHPTYELIVSTAQYLGADVKRFHRDPANGFALDPTAVQKALTSRTRLIVLTNLHNPSSSLANESAVREIGDIARSVGGRVLVDEVYLDAVFEDTPRSSFFLGDHFIVTNSLTKVYGLSGLRCGWVLAQPDLAQRMWRLNDLFGVIPAHAAERLSIIALQEMPRIRETARRLLNRNQEIVNNFLSLQPALEAEQLQQGTVVFPRLRSGRVDRFCAFLRENYETTVVPGGFFEMPNHFRIGIGCDPALLQAGLGRLGDAIAAFPHF